MLRSWDVISNYLPVYTDGMHEQFLFQPTRNAAGDTFVAVNNNDTRLVSTLRGKNKVLFLMCRFNIPMEICSANRIKIRRRQYVCDRVSDEAIFISNVILTLRVILLTFRLVTITISFLLSDIRTLLFQWYNSLLLTHFSTFQQLIMTVLISYI